MERSWVTGHGGCRLSHGRCWEWVGAPTSPQLLALGVLAAGREKGEDADGRATLPCAAAGHEATAALSARQLPLTGHSVPKGRARDAAESNGETFPCRRGKLHPHDFSAWFRCWRGLGGLYKKCTQMHQGQLSPFPEAPASEPRPGRVWQELMPSLPGSPGFSKQLPGAALQAFSPAESQSHACGHHRGRRHRPLHRPVHP